ncbi:serine/threonine-protein kinase [Crocosphaera sp. UHCC 0190]|uniref:serine/threonine protein kinase n=1 Tax=Crocosphaera sp. UHCC 0190 TaxID=3110246 RepID=UPI002B219DCC|nr:serine/threonine-protein kinase [Crocosphaera sp. UHCC 0190]MEA5510363.1 serine/threonine-protein kinase [Crocosphaera sp. UHCC 0190]
MSLCINPHCSNPENQDTSLFCQSCGSELLLEGRYRVLKELGGGGFGKTYEVQDSDPTHFGEGHQAVKVLKVLIHNHPKYVELFEREAQFLSRFNHPGIPKVEPDAHFLFYLKNSSTPLYCLVMEKIEGLNLNQYIMQRGKCISQKVAIQWLMQLLRILQEIHRHNFFHRDIKPSNVMLRSTGQLVLIDFGTAREVTATYLSKQSSGQVTGLFSAGYSPLEQLNGQAVPQSDFFALGRTMVYLLAGKHPSDFYDAHVDQLNWRGAVPDLAPEFADLLDHIMARLPNERPQSAGIILSQLEQIYHHLYGSDSFLNNFPSQDVINEGEIPTRTAPPTVPPLPLPPKPQSPSFAATQDVLAPSFVARCQAELAELIGPMASIICQKTWKKNPNASADEFVKALAQKIPDPQKAQGFQQKLLS